jgi:predicted aminopeptidase
MSLLCFLCTGCQIGYYVKSAYSQISMLASATPIDQSLKDPTLNEDEKRKLLLAQEAREFAEKELHLKETKNYRSFVKLDRPYVTYVVSASMKWELKHHLWGFPIVGEMPYKGFFNEQDAIAEENELIQQNLDTYRRGVAAYSTLGWFHDPLLSSMLRYKDHDLVNTIIHETVHATIYIKNSADFNERMAVFLGNKGMEIFYLKKEGTDSKTLAQIQKENQDDRLFSQFISTEIQNLDAWYKSNPERNEDLRMKRIAEIQEHFTANVLPKMKTDSYSRFSEVKLNNARLLNYKTYMQDLSDFENLYQKVGGNFQEFLKRCKSLEKSDHPEEDLKTL